MRSNVFVLIIAGAIVAGPALAQPKSPAEATRAFLDAYARGDAQAVAGMVEPDVTVYGSDVAEVAHGPDGVRRMLANDAKLWGGPVQIGPMDHVTLTSEGRLAVLTFDAPFLLPGRPAVPVRFSMAWRRGASGWRLAQSANATPTVGQSAEELLKGAGR